MRFAVVSNPTLDKWRVAQPLQLNFRVADTSQFFEGSEGLVFTSARVADPLAGGPGGK